ncbi:glycosyltransferase [Fructobacillus evanidus]|uniref:Catalytic subunit of cellulose synthase and poly-beta-1 n=1 Tax=Fructobacillus evanidus TaxID=3064281 RepID=A0ABM9ML48_9LACO|nr:6-N-acetylglucosamine synthase (BcsA) [Fructobacillus sp. LMG 32999]CAK1223612.1 6-N-acetylglucosamine synthase (BcsA) [Fructobacillus sp. LMG 32999]CAK1223696.1 6-N-acetylglucosamine synthase (BcsA) [Fructobacillus sp. LMG 32999]CAK1231002.1 6-N-acetylglucosamine synthase (BcsA) [Fructobacillus sp. LMG 32999]CAK1250817.1 6-N-acetylglucosamine synthase (BcsA) [Fructobacillus sp. LMG 32999]
MSVDIKEFVNQVENYLWPSEQEYQAQAADFTVLLPVYIRDDLENFIIAIKSIFKNTVKPSEILIMEDGPVADRMADFLAFLTKKYPNVAHCVANPKNHGLGYTAARGILLAKFEIIARVDADDISTARRFEEELKRFRDNLQLDIVGSNVAEFNEDYEIQSYRNVPSQASDICQFSKMRSPFNHPSVMYRKQAVIDAGNYADIQHFEDYDLFVRMLEQGQIAENIADNLVLMRAPSSMYQRRGGQDYVQRYIAFRKGLLKKGYISQKEYQISILGSLLTSYSPVFVRKIRYHLFLRENK